jgi:catechol 2,3-dioxygenase-like lactoylglutathione lyase family enzyme
VSPLVEVRRLLHTNYNCRNVALLERWYGELFAMKPVMKSVADDTHGIAFGLRTVTAHETSFLYDHRGGRKSCSLELVKWVSPPTLGRPYEHPWDHGIQAVAFTVPDVDAIERKLAVIGGTLVRRSSDWLLLHDPEDLPVEVYRGSGELPERAHLRAVVHDLERTVAWWERLGFRPVPHAAVAAAELWPAEREHAVAKEVTLVGTDDPTFGIRFTTWSGPPPEGPTYGFPGHQGLFRIAMAVDDVTASAKRFRDEGIAAHAPYHFALPGTKITEGLRILFFHDPDGIVGELVERPRSFFTK